MTGLWQIVTKETTTNLCTNPSVEVATTGWAAMAGAIARSTDDPPAGVYDLKCTPAVGVDDGCYFGTVSLTSGTTYTASVYVKGVNAIPYQLYFATTVPAVKGTPVEFTGDGEWHRQEVTWACDGTASYRVYITKNDNASVGPYYIDALQVEAKAYATTYCDGSIDPPTGFPSSGCSWNGVAHASTSTRVATSRAGGLVKNFDDFYFYITNPTGLGAAPVTNYFTEYAQLAGALHEHTKTNSRLMILNGLLKASTLANLHSYRSTLLAAVAPTADEQPVRLRYTGSGKTLEISMYYDGGMEAGVREGFNERLGLRFYAPTPNWREVVV